MSREVLIDAEAACVNYAIKLRKDAKKRSNGGAHLKAHRAWLRECADRQDVAAKEIRSALDASF